jgi:membrane protein DedA with SNARE-associated domain
MRYRSFFLANTLGGLTWGLGFTLLGYFAGHALHTVEKYASWAGISILVLAIIFFIWHHRRTVRREAREENEWTKDHPEQAPES